MDRVYDMIIIGGGASGLMVATRLAGRGLSVALCEAGARVGKKLLMTGNGKCNMLNTSCDVDNYNTPYVSIAISNYNPTKVIEVFYQDYGLLTRELDGRVYPYSECATTVLGALMNKLDNVDVKVNCCVTGIISDSVGYCVVTTIGNYYTKAVCISTGSAASVGLNSGGLLEPFGHRVTPLRAALLPISTSDRSITAMQGVRHKVRLTLIHNGGKVADKLGEVQFKQGAISGIVSFEISSIMARHNIDNAEVNIDFLPDYNEQAAVELLCSIAPDMMFNKSIAACIVARAAGNNPVQLARVAKCYKIQVSRCSDTKLAQVICGGLDVTQFDRATMMSKLAHNIYAVGEALNVDGDCGGYNLHWSWASALLLADNYK